MDVKAEKTAAESEEEVVELGENGWEIKSESEPDGELTLDGTQNGGVSAARDIQPDDLGPSRSARLGDTDQDEDTDIKMESDSELDGGGGKSDVKVAGRTKRVISAITPPGTSSPSALAATSRSYAASIHQAAIRDNAIDDMPEWDRLPTDISSSHHDDEDLVDNGKRRQHLSAKDCKIVSAQSSRGVAARKGWASESDGTDGSEGADESSASGSVVTPPRTASINHIRASTVAVPYAIAQSNTFRQTCCAGRSTPSAFQNGLFLWLDNDLHSHRYRPSAIVSRSRTWNIKCDRDLRKRSTRQISTSWPWFWRRETG
jgi:hypothetical protein